MYIAHACVQVLSREPTVERNVEQSRIDLTKPLTHSLSWHSPGVNNWLLCVALP